MRRTGKWVDSADVAAGRFAALFGVFFASGSAFIIVATVLGAFPNGDILALHANSVMGLTIGLVLLAVRHRELPRWFYLALWVGVSIALSIVVLTAGVDRIGVPGVLFVYLSCVTFAAFRSLAPALVVLVSSLHLGALLVQIPVGEAVGIWALTWGVAVIAGLVVGELVAGNQSATRGRDDLLLRLKQDDEAKTALLNAVGHQLAKPMTAMQGLAQTVAERGDELPADARRELMDRVVAASGRMTETLDELLGVTRLTPGRVVLDLERLPVGDLLELAVQRAEVDPAGVVVVASPIELTADHGRLAHAIANLITNAERYGGAADIEVAARQVGDRVEVRVADRGPGIPDAAKRVVFDPFVRARDGDTGKGMGIGLSLVNRFAVLHDGSAWVEDREGGGTVAVLSVPVDGPGVSGVIAPAGG